MGHLKQAAIGFRVHSGWAAVVAVCVEKGAPIVLVKQRVHLVDTFTYEFRQPYHTAEKMLLGQAREFIARMQAEARRLAYRAIRELASRTQEQGVKLTRCGLLLASGRPLPGLEKILRLKSAVLMRRVTELGRPFGAPWSQDEKFATLAAWLTLATPPQKTPRGTKSPRHLDVPACPVILLPLVFSLEDS